MIDPGLEGKTVLNSGADNPAGLAQRLPEPLLLKAPGCSCTAFASVEVLVNNAAHWDRHFCRYLAQNELFGFIR